MNKFIKLSIMVSFLFVIVVPAQEVSSPATSKDTSIATQSVVSSNKSLSKISGVKPRTNSNWSKIKDLFM